MLDLWNEQLRWFRENCGKISPQYPLACAEFLLGLVDVAGAEVAGELGEGTAEGTGAAPRWRGNPGSAAEICSDTINNYSTPRNCRQYTPLLPARNFCCHILTNWIGQLQTLAPAAGSPSLGDRARLCGKKILLLVKDLQPPTPNS